MSDIEIIHGPTPPSAAGSVIYSVTLGNGYVVTNPQGFGPDVQQNEPRPTPQPLPTQPRPIIPTR